MNNKEFMDVLSNGQDEDVLGAAVDYAFETVRDQRTEEAKRIHDSEWVRRFFDTVSREVWA